VPATELLPLLLGVLAAALLAPAALRSLSAGRLEQENYRGVRLPFPAGTVIVAAAALALVPLSILHELADVDVFRGDVRTVLVYAVGVAFLGLLDDVLAAEHRGWRGHGAAVLGGGLSTGALKAAGSLGLALYALGDHGYGAGEYVLAVLLLVLTTNLFNLLDLRPGRSFKAFLALGVGLTLGAWDAGPLATLGVLAGPVLVVGLYDLRERAMLGDTGSNLIGALAGLWLVLTLGTVGQAVALAVVLALTVYGEFRSISSLVDRNPLLRQLDSLGRPA
jgi:UDP-N-acetylmuramyl pentapeptide phosphotransferase/UDP-N-acetylglucosamine-1-phosphate transferase